jgi:hypothetical protein
MRQRSKELYVKMGGLDKLNVQPSAKITLPSENSPSHYYAARTPRSAPLTVNSKNGAEHEQFLFYRGVSVAVSPLSAMVLRSGQVEAMNQTGEIIPMLVYFERRGEKVGFRWLPSLPGGAILDAPLLVPVPADQPLLLQQRQVFVDRAIG